MHQNLKYKQTKKIRLYITYLKKTTKLSKLTNIVATQNADLTHYTITVKYYQMIMYI